MYHNYADPWAGDQGFTTGSLRPEQLERFLAADDTTSTAAGCCCVSISRSWEPADSDLERLYLKNCDQRDVPLSG